MGFNDHDVTIEDLTTGLIYTYEAVSQVRSVNPDEVGQEPGVVGSIGPPGPRRFSWKLRAYGDPEAGGGLPGQGRLRGLILARRQALAIDEKLRGKPLLICHRTLPAGVVWQLDNVNPIDENEAKNSWDIEISAVELVGWNERDGMAGALNIALGTIVIPVAPPPLEEPEQGTPYGPQLPTGTGGRACVPGEKKGWVSGPVTRATWDGMKGAANGLADAGKAIGRGFVLAGKAISYAAVETWQGASGAATTAVTSTLEGLGIIERDVQRCDI